MPDGTHAAPCEILYARCPWVSEALAPLQQRGLPRLLGVRSPLGTGKTAALGPLLRDAPQVLYLTPRAALARQAAARLDLGCYLDLPAGPARGPAVRGANRLALNCLSLHHTVAGAPAAAERVLILDELRLLLRTILNDDRQPPGRRRALYAALLSLVRESRQVIALDAHLEPADLLQISPLGHTPALLINTPDRPTGTLTACDPLALTARALASAAAGAPALLLTTSATEARAVAAVAAQRGLRALAITAADRDRPEARRWLDDPQAPGCTFDLVCATHTIGTGYSIDTRPDGSPRFPVVCVHAALLPGMHPDELHQLFGRVRGTPDTYYAFAGRAPAPATDARLLSRSVLQRYVRLRQSHPAPLRPGDLPLVRGWAHAEHARRRDARLALHGGFDAALRAVGWRPGAHNPRRDLQRLATTAPALRAALDAATRALHEAEIAALRAAPLPPDLRRPEAAEAWAAADPAARSLGDRLDRALSLCGLDHLPPAGSDDDRSLDRLLRDGDAPILRARDLLSPDRARDRDADALQRGASPLDVPFAEAQARVLRDLLTSAGVAPEALLLAPQPLCPTDETLRLLAVHREFLSERLGVRATIHPSYLPRVLGTLLRRVGADLHARRLRAAPWRSYTACWPEEVRRLLSPSGTSPREIPPHLPPPTDYPNALPTSTSTAAPTPLPSTAPSLSPTSATAAEPAFPGIESLTTALDRRALLHIHPGAAPALHLLSTNPSTPARDRLSQLFTRADQTGETVYTQAQGWSAEPSGRLHLYGPSLQQTPRRLRPFVSAGPGRALIDVDMRGAHLLIAAALSGDSALLATATSGDLYADLARDLHADRDDAKRATLAALNGAENRAARLLFARYPALSAFRADTIAVWQADPAAPITFCSPAGRRVTVPARPEPTGWRTALSARWLAAEADLTAYALRRLHGRIGPHGGRLALPMFDGLLLSAPDDQIDPVSRAVADLYAEAGRALLNTPVPTRTRSGPRWSD